MMDMGRVNVPKVLGANGGWCATSVGVRMPIWDLQPLKTSMKAWGELPD